MNWRLFLKCFALLLMGGLVVSAEIFAPQKATDFTLPSATDNSLIRLSDHGGKVILINWWRTKCGYAKREVPKLVELYKKYRGQGLEIIGVSDDTMDSVGTVADYLRASGVTWPVGLNDQGEFMRDIRPLGSGSTPENYLVSRNGEITYLGLDRSADSWAQLEQAAVQALAAPAPAQNPIEASSLEDAPGFSLQDLAGKTVGLDDFRGKPLIVNFFFSGTCDWTGDLLQKLYDAYSSEGMQVIGINLYDKEPDLRCCLDKYQVKYPVLKADQKTQKAWVGDRGGWGVFFVTSDGKILKRIVNKIQNGIESVVFKKYAEYLLK